MRLTGVRSSWVFLIGVSSLSMGCTGLTKSEPRPNPFYLSASSTVSHRSGSKTSKSLEQAEIVPAGVIETKAQEQSSTELVLKDVKELTAEVLVDNVLARNPSITQMNAAWQAASARFPQVTSLDDPLAGTTLAPAALGSSPAGYRVELFQRIPYPGKLSLRGEIASAEAIAVSRDVEGMRQQLTEAARDAFYEYYLIARSAEVNDEVVKSLRMSRSNAETLFTTGKVKQQDMLVLDVEIGRRRNRSILLDRQKAVAVARINALLHQAQDTPLPPPPKSIKVEGELPDPRKLQEQALAQRLDLMAINDRITGAQAAVQLAQKEYYPDFDLMAAYDNMWDDQKMRAQVGVRINLPMRLAKREGAVAEAHARLVELQSQLSRQQDQAAFEVQQAYEQWRESHRSIRLFEAEVLPAAQLSVKAAQAGYVPGDVPLLVLLEAQRNLADLQEQYYQATAEYFRRRTVLQRTLSGPPSSSPLPVPAERPSPGQPGAPTGMSSRM
jgi:outer membrane protein TolC